MDEEELQEADVLWPWLDTPPPSPENDEEEGYLPPPALPELYEYDAAAAVEFSCEPFSGPPPASSGSSLTTPSAEWSDGWSSSGGFFLSGRPSSAGSAGLGGLDAAEEFLEADVLWPDTPDDEAAGFWWRCCRRVEEAAAAATTAAACGEREGWRPLVSSPIDIPMAARGAAAAAARRRPSPLPAVLARRRW